VEGDDAEIRREIEALVAEAVARFGMAGQVRCEAGQVVLFGHGPDVAIEIGMLVEQWDALAPDVRQRRITEIARRLVGRRRESAAPAVSGAGFRLPAWIAPIVILGLGGAGIWAAYRWLGPKTPAVASAAPVLSADAYEAERRERSQRVCEATRTRVMRGASVGPSDVEGWVVEIRVLRGGETPELELDPGLAAFVDRPRGARSGRFVWSGAKELVAIQGVDTTVEIADASLPPGKTPKFRGIRATFSGRYAIPYFSEEERPAFVRTAAAIAEQVGASHAALYARCGHGATYHLGAWFLGPGPAGAATSLIYFMGLHTDIPQVERSVLEPAGAKADPALSLERLGDALAPLDRARLATLIGAHGGMIAGRNTGPVTLTFPFRDSNRAARASHDLARAVKIAAER
jgi:hypothetical protein